MSTGVGPPVGTYSGPVPWILALLLDAILVTIFAAIGRASHQEAVGLLSLMSTAWPFLAGMAAGWVVVRIRHLPGTSIPTGILVWVFTWAGGMVLRIITGAGTAPSFLVVAGTALAVFLVGWRLIARGIQANRSHRPV